MRLYNQSDKIKEIRGNLIFFCLLTLLMGCRQVGGLGKVQVTYSDVGAVNVRFESHGNPKHIAVFLVGESETAVLGSMKSQGNTHWFTPALKFTDRQDYEIRERGLTLAHFTIDNPKVAVAPEILAIYPNTDTVPENLLKIYLEFSLPIQEVGRALDFIKVSDGSNAETDIFLDLENELWNKAHDRLTLWLNPGRIKTDLIPNRELGMPLSAGKSYTIQVEPNWKSAHGKTLGRPYTKTFFVTKADCQKPTLSAWALNIPKKSTLLPLTLDLIEPMDAILLRETLSVISKTKGPLQGTIRLGREERTWAFYPEAAWEAGVYFLEVASRLEDLAGNNLNHLFDTDLRQDQDMGITSETKVREFVID